MLSFTLTNRTKLTATLTELPQKMYVALLRKITALTLQLEAYVKDEKLSGQVLQHKSGRLWRSIQSKVDATPEEIVGRVFSAGDVKYAAIHEYGGTINHPGGTAYMVIAGVGAVFISNAKAEVLKIMKRTKPHTIDMPERSYLRSSLDDMKQDIMDGISVAVAEGATP